MNAIRRRLELELELGLRPELRLKLRLGPLLVHIHTPACWSLVSALV